VNELTLELNEHPSQDELRELVDGVRVYNRAITGHERPRAVACFLRDDAGHIIGGAHGDLWGRSVHIAAMWVAESHRGKGHGSALLKAVESYAASHGHVLAYLETTSFQVHGGGIDVQDATVLKGCEHLLPRKRKRQLRAC
jgi:GNAT superfamily N-acetyltransferase